MIEKDNASIKIIKDTILNDIEREIYIRIMKNCNYCQNFLTCQQCINNHSFKNHDGDPKARDAHDEPTKKDYVKHNHTYLDFLEKCKENQVWREQTKKIEEYSNKIKRANQQIIESQKCLDEFYANVDIRIKEFKKKNKNDDKNDDENEDDE